MCGCANNSTKEVTGPSYHSLILLLNSPTRHPPTSDSLCLSFAVTVMPLLSRFRDPGEGKGGGGGGGRVTRGEISQVD